MSIDVSVPGSPGWWMQRLYRALTDQKRVQRLNALDAWYVGNPPLPEGATAAQSAFRAFQSYARSNFALLVVEAVRERMRPRGIRTSADSDNTGDSEAWRVWRRAGMRVISAEAHRMALRLAECPVIVGPVDERTRVPVITAEDPRCVITEQDPAFPGRSIAALKLEHDDLRGVDLAWLYRPGRLDVAFRKAARASKTMPRWDHKSWDLSPDGASSDPTEGMSGELPYGLMPVTLLRNVGGVAEFEPFIDLMRRINHMILQRMMIATLQAFRQRAFKGLPQKDDNGAAIDWNSILSADPAAVWALPASVEVWESGQVDLSPILSAVKADVQHLSAVSRTPLPMLQPEGENQSAEGAAAAKEGLVFKVEDRCDVAAECWSQVIATAFLWMDQPERADLNSIDVLWAPPERASLSERASAAAQAATAGVPWRTRMIDVMQFSPDKVDKMETERADDMMLAQQLALMQAVTAVPAGDGTAGAA